jgi:hypothetical protein
MLAGGERSPVRTRLGCLIAGALLSGFVVSDARAQPSEYAIKAEFIERFTRFIDWPQEAFPSPEAPFVLCVMGDNPFGDYLERLARERRVKDRKVRLLQIARVSEVDACHLVFIAASERNREREVVARTQGKSILTIGDTPGFAEVGVILNFFLEQDRIRFEINLDEARRTGLTFSSKLLKLARVVPPRGGP